MAQYEVAEPEEMMKCPYDGEMVRASRFPYHLVRCKKSYRGKEEFQICLFNAKHHILKSEYRHHIATCPDKSIIEQEISYTCKKEDGGSFNVLKGCTDNPVYKNIEFESEEDWDAEISAPVRRGPAYDSDYHDRVQFKDVSGLTKQQQAIVQDNRLTTQEKMGELREFEDGDNNLRLPNTPSMVAMGMQPQAPQVSSSIAHQVAHGRGRGVAKQGITPMTNGVVPSGVRNYNMNMPVGRGRAVGRGTVFNGGVGHSQEGPGFIMPKVNKQ